MKEGLIRMETEHRESGQRRSLIAAIVGVLLYAAVTAAVVLCYPFVVGVLFAVFRTEFRGTVGIPALVLAHWISNLF